jgi:hypothetical protein
MSGELVHGAAGRRGPNRDGSVTVVCLCGESWCAADLGGLWSAWDALAGHLVAVGAPAPGADRGPDGVILAGLMRAAGADGNAQLAALRDHWLGLR